MHLRHCHSLATHLQLAHNEVNTLAGSPREEVVFFKNVFTTIFRAVAIVVAVVNIWNPIGWTALTWAYVIGAAILASTAVQLMPAKFQFMFDLALSLFNVVESFTMFGAWRAAAATYGPMASSFGLNVLEFMTWVSEIPFIALWAAGVSTYLLCIEYYDAFLGLGFVEANLQLGEDLGSMVGTTVAAVTALATGVATGIATGLVSGVSSSSLLTVAAVLVGGYLGYRWLTADDDATSRSHVTINQPAATTAA